MLHTTLWPGWSPASRISFLVGVAFLLSAMVGTSVAAPVCWAGATNYNNNNIDTLSSISRTSANGTTVVYWTSGPVIYRSRTDGTERVLLVCRTAVPGCIRVFDRLRNPFAFKWVNNFLYWSDSQARLIARVPTNNNGPVQIVVCRDDCEKDHPNFGDGGIAAYQVDDSRTDKLYWTGNTFIGRVPLPGHNGSPQRVICASGCPNRFNVSGIVDLQLDLVSSTPRMYWANAIRLGRSKLDGSQPERIACSSGCRASNSRIQFLSFLSLDLVSPTKRIYFTSNENVWRTELDGDNLQNILCSPTQPCTNKLNLEIPFRIHAVGSPNAGTKVYVLDTSGAWTRSNGDGSDATRILCAPKEANCQKRWGHFGFPYDPAVGVGPGVKFTWSSGFGVVYFDAITGNVQEPGLKILRPTWLVPTSSGALIWAHQGRIMAERADSCNLRAGQQGRARQILCPVGCRNEYPQILSQPQNIRLDVSGKWYWTDNFIGGVLSSNTDGTDPQLIACATGCPRVIPDHSPTELKIDARDNSALGKKVYWIDVGNGPRVWQANLDGSGRRLLKCGNVRPNLCQPAPPPGLPVDSIHDIQLDTRGPTPIIYFLGDDTLVRMRGDGTDYRLVVCVPSTSPGPCTVNVNTNDMRVPVSLRLNFAGGTRRGLWVDIAQHHVSLFIGNENPSYLQAACKTNSTGKCRFRLNGLQSLTSELLVADVGNGDTWVYYVGFFGNDNWPGIVRQRLHSQQGPVLEAPQIVVCGQAGNCPNKVDMRIPTNLAIRQDSSTGQFELWWIDFSSESPSIAPFSSGLWRAFLNGGGAHIDIPSAVSIPAFCRAQNGTTQAQCDQLCLSGTNTGQCTQARCRCSSS